MKWGSAAPILVFGSIATFMAVVGEPIVALIMACGTVVIAAQLAWQLRRYAESVTISSDALETRTIGGRTIVIPWEAVTLVEEARDMRGRRLHVQSANDSVVLTDRLGEFSQLEAELHDRAANAKWRRSGVMSTLLGATFT
jgi:hypothetical protein